MKLHSLRKKVQLQIIYHSMRGNMKAANNSDLLNLKLLSLSLTWSQWQQIVCNVVYPACEAWYTHDRAYTRGYKIFSQQLMEKHLSAVFWKFYLGWRAWWTFDTLVYKCRSGWLSDKSMGENLIWAQCNHVSICPFVSFSTSDISYSTDGAGCGAENQRMIMTHIVCLTITSLKKF